MSETIRELLISIGLGGDAPEKMEGLDKKIGELGKHFKEFGETVIAALGIEKLGEFVENQAKLGAEILHTSERLGIATDELQKWQYVAGQSGLSAESMAGSLKLLERNMGNAAQGGSRMGRAFQASGIELKDANGNMRNVSDVLTDISDAIKKTPEGAERTAKAMQLMGRQGAAMIPLLSQGSEEIHKQMEEAEALGGILSKEYLESAHKAEQESNKLAFAWKGMKASLAAELFPAFSSIMSLFSKGIAIFHKMTENTTFFRVALMALGAVAAYTVVPAFIDLAGAMIGAAEGAGILEIVMSPMILVFAVAAIAIMALILIFDDLWGMFQGKDSLIGALIDKFYGFGATQGIITDMKKAWDELVKTFDETKKIFDDFSKSFTGDKGMTVMTWMAKNFTHAMVFALRSVEAVIKGLTTMLKIAGHGGKIIEDLKNGDFAAAAAEQKSVASLLVRGVAETQGTLFKPVRGSTVREANIPAFRRPAAPTTNNVTINQHGVHGENVGEKTAQAVRDANEDNDNANAMDALGSPEADEGID